MWLRENFILRMQHNGQHRFRGPLGARESSRPNKKMLTPPRALSLGVISCREYRTMCQGKFPQEASWFCLSPENSPLKPIALIVRVFHCFRSQMWHIIRASFLRPAPPRRRGLSERGQRNSMWDARGNEITRKGCTRLHSGSGAYSSPNI